MKKSNFDGVAPFYDLLAKLTFGNTLIRSQTIFLEDLKAHDEVLILGGGTGWVLQELNHLKIPLKVTYVEPSAKMMQLSKEKNNLSYLDICFIQQTFEETTLETPFSDICTFYFLDLFREKELNKIISKIKSLSNQDTKWLFADFSIVKTSPWYHKWLVRLMFLFFRNFAGLQSHQLLDYQNRISNAGFEEVKSRNWKRGLIHASLFRATFEYKV